MSEPHAKSRGPKLRVYLTSDIVNTYNECGDTNETARLIRIRLGPMDEAAVSEVLREEGIKIGPAAARERKKAYDPSEHPEDASYFLHAHHRFYGCPAFAAKNGWRGIGPEGYKTWWRYLGLEIVTMQDLRDRPMIAIVPGSNGTRRSRGNNVYVRV